MKFYTRFNPAPKITLCQKGEKTRTVQSEKDSCDVNKIMERFNRTGQVSHIVSAQPQFQDNTSTLPYEEALMTIQHAQEQFMSLPAKTRQYFGQDPKNFVETILNPSEGDLKFFREAGIVVDHHPPVEQILLEQIAKNTSQQKVDEK